MSNWPKGIAKPVIRALQAAGYTSIEQLENTDEASLMKLHGKGPKAMEVIKRIFRQWGFSPSPTDG